ncbi:hypothetical protein [Rhodococcus koreensis]
MSRTRFLQRLAVALRDNRRDPMAPVTAGLVEVRFRSSPEDEQGYPAVSTDPTTRTAPTLPLAEFRDRQRIAACRDRNPDLYFTRTANAGMPVPAAANRHTDLRGAGLSTADR